MLIARGTNKIFRLICSNLINSDEEPSAPTPSLELWYEALLTLPKPPKEFMPPALGGKAEAKERVYCAALAGDGILKHYLIMRVLAKHGGIENLTLEFFNNLVSAAGTNCNLASVISDLVPQANCPNVEKHEHPGGTYVEALIFHVSELTDKPLATNALVQLADWLLHHVEETRRFRTCGKFRDPMMAFKEDYGGSFVETDPCADSSKKRKTISASVSFIKKDGEEVNKTVVREIVMGEEKVKNVKKKMAMELMAEHVALELDPEPPRQCVQIPNSNATSIIEDVKPISDNVVKCKQGDSLTDWFLRKCAGRKPNYWHLLECAPSVFPNVIRAVRGLYYSVPEEQYKWSGEDSLEEKVRVVFSAVILDRALFRTFVLHSESASGASLTKAKNKAAFRMIYVVVNKAGLSKRLKWYDEDN